MNKKRIISALMAISLIILQLPSFAETDDSQNEGTQVTVSETQSTSEAKKEMIASDDFSKGISSWEIKTGDGFYVIGEKLVFDNINEKISPSLIVSKQMAVDNGEIEFLMNVKKGDYIGIVFRMEDDKTLYTLRFYYNLNKVMLLKRVKGGEYVTVKDTKTALEYNKDYKVGITLIGKKIGVKLDSNELFTVEDSSLKSGKIGFEGFQSRAEIDNVELFKYDNVEYDVVEVDTSVKETKTIYVSADGGAEGADGSIENPYKTIDEAKEAVKKLKKGNTPIDVIFMEGTYPVTSTISFTAADSGTEKAPIRYMAQEGADVVFSGATRLDVTKFEPVSDDVKSRLYDSVKDKVLQMDIKEQGIPEDLADFTKPGENGQVGQNLKPLIITLNNSRQSIARWPNSGYNDVLSCEPGDNARNAGNKDSAGTIYYSESNPSRWVNADRLYIEGFLGTFWHGEWAKVDNIDTSNNAINMRYYTQYGIANNHRWAAVNLLEEIDIPGEWYIDPTAMILYYYPPYELTEDDVLEVATLKTNMLDITGAENITFEGIEFTMTADDPAVSTSNNKGGNGINIGTGSKNILIKDCIISHIGMHGINIDTTDVTIDGCLIYDIGFNGINAGNCGDRKTLTPSNVVIKNCDISDVCRDTGSNGCGGIILQEASVDVTITNNIIHNCKNSVIRYSGNGHQILYNEFYNAVTQTADAGAIYAGRSWAEYGTAIKYNFFHDIGQKNNNGNYPASSIFWDDYQSGGEFSYNISVVNNYTKTSTVKIGGGVDNIVKGNTMVSSEYDIIGEDRSSSQQIDWPNYAATTLKLSTVPYTSPEFTSKYPQIAALLPRVESNNNVLKLENTIVGNLTVDCLDSRIANTIIEASEYRDNVTIASDYSVFVDPENLDYRVTKEAKEKYGISDEVIDEDFDLDKIGIINDYEFDKSRLNFIATYPETGTQNIETKDVMIAWSKSPVADDYHYIIATDPDFENIVSEDITEYQSVKIEGLENAQTYYWKVYARNNSRQYRCEVEASNGIMNFTTSEFDTLDKSVLNDRIEKAKALLETIVEGNGVGEYRTGTIAEIEKQISEAEQLAALEKGLQSDIDYVAYTLNNFINNIESFVNSGYTTLNISPSSSWYANNDATTIVPGNGTATINFVNGTEVSLEETLSNYNVMCFRTKIGTLDGTWVSYGLRALDKDTPMYSQDAYYILVKQDIFELQKHGAIYATAPNNGKMKAGEWYDVQFGAITTQNGVNMIFKLNGEVIFDYLDKNDPQNRPGMFAVFGSNNTVEIAAATDVPNELYQISDKILAEMNTSEETGMTLDITDDGYVETGTWVDNSQLQGDNGTKVRTASNSKSSAKWIMESGSEGNGKLYKVSYYHIPSADGDKNVKVDLSGYAGEYSTTIDLSQGEEGYVELGTFTFMAADYIGRLAVTFTGSGQGTVNVSNIKYELVDESEYSNMLN